MNKVLLIGRLTRDAEILDINNTESRALRFTLAVDRRFKSSVEGNDADFIPIVYFCEQANKLLLHMTKGRLISVSGKVRVRSVDGEGGTRKYYTNIVADSIDFLDSSKANAH